MRAQSIAGVVLLLACLAPWAHADPGQTPMDKATAKAAEAAPKDQSDDALAKKAGAAESSTAMPAAPSAVVLNDASTRQKYLTAMQRYYQYRADGYAYRSRVFEWQLFSSRVIFVIVFVLVGAGIYFAAVQFHATMLPVRREAAIDAPDDSIRTTLTTQLEVSAKGVVVNSSVVGVIILTLSLAFFYLYLVYVYPIQNVF